MMQTPEGHGVLFNSVTQVYSCMGTSKREVKEGCDIPGMEIVAFFVYEDDSEEAKKKAASDALALLNQIWLTVNLGRAFNIVNNDIVFTDTRKTDTKRRRRATG
jgi:hypothetical protein